MFSGVVHMGREKSDGGDTLKSESTGESQNSSVKEGEHGTKTVGLYNSHKLDVSKGIISVDQNLLKSGIAILPGSKNLQEESVVFIFTGSPLWRNQQVSSTELARLLLYFQSISQEGSSPQGITIVANVRNTTSSIINSLLESFYLCENHHPGCLKTVHILAEKATQALVLRSPVYDATGNVKIDIVLSPEQLHMLIDPSQLPMALDGHFNYHHESWIRFRTRLEPFMTSCQVVSKYLMDTKRQFTDLDVVPKTMQEACSLIENHDQHVRSTFEAPQLALLQDEGNAALSKLKDEEDSLGHTDDYRGAMKCVEDMYRQLQKTMAKLVKLAENRLDKLEQGLQLREYEAECNKIFGWISVEEKLFNHPLADNLKAAHQQQKEFSQAYHQAMTRVKKGNDLIEEGSMLSQTGNNTDAAGYRDLVKNLRQQLGCFTNQLEESKKQIESNYRCYSLLDKCYEWALETMKYVASMNMEFCTSAEGCDKVIKSLECYIEEHPPLQQDLFTHMLDQSEKVDNDKLVEQCKTAKGRCEETLNLLLLRQSALQRAKNHFEAKERMVSEKQCTTNENVQPSNCITSPLSLKGISLSDAYVTNFQAIASTQQQNLTARNGASGSQVPGEFSYSPKQPKHLSIQKVVECEEQLFSDGLITEDMSHRVVTCLPKGLTNTRLRGSNENLLDSSSSKDGKIFPRSASGFLATHLKCPTKKHFKRAPGSSVVISGPIQDKNALLPDERLQRCSKIASASTESLSTIPDEGDYQSSQKSFLGSANTSRHLGLSPGLASRPLTSNVDKRGKRNVFHLTQEIIQTERDYVKSLQLIINNYIPELQQENVPRPLWGKENTIFGNIECIYQFHLQCFLQELESCEEHPFQIGHCFLSHEEEFNLYALYNKNKPKSDELLSEHGAFFMNKQTELGDMLDLSSYLLKPLQRLTKYAQFLMQLLKECPEADPDYTSLKAAEEMIKFNLRHGNDLLAMDSLKDCDVNLQEQGRLLRQDEFIVWQGRKKAMRHVFLFEDLILFSKTRRDRNGVLDSYVYKHSFKTSDMGLTEKCEDNSQKFEIWFRRRCLGVNYVMQAQSLDDKKAWVGDISLLLWRQAIKNRENKRCELASMGIGNKPRLDLQLSDNYIQDRYVNLGSRLAWARNSVPSIPGNVHRIVCKRPMSVISTLSSSSSSSDSNQSSHGVGTDNPPNQAASLWDYQFQRRSFASSDESGIGSDICTKGHTATMAMGRDNEDQLDATAAALRLHFSPAKNQMIPAQQMTNLSETEC